MTGTPKRGAGAKSQSYLELFFEPKAMTIMVPVDSLDEVGIRGVATREEAEAILDLLAEPSDVAKVWAERNAKTLSRIQSTELTQAAMVIRDLTRHAGRSDKPLSAAENTSLQTCLDTVSMELSLALDMSQSDTRDLILDKVSTAAVGEPDAS